MAIQDVINNCCDGLKSGAQTVASYASASAQWAGRTISAAGTYMLDGANKAAAYAKPYFENLVEFAKANQSTLLSGLGCLAVGAALYAIFSRCFGSGTTTNQQQQQQV